MLSLYTLFALMLLALTMAVFFLLVLPIDLALALKLDENDFRGRATLKWLFFSYGFSTEDGMWKGEGGGLIGKLWKRKEKGEGKAGEKEEKEEALETRKREEKKEKEEAGKAGEKKKEKKEKKKEKKGREFSFYLKVFRALYRPFFRLCADFLGAVKFREFDCFLAFGSGNPADTGMACGFLHGLKGVLEARCACCRFGFSPNFLEPEFRLRGRAELRVRPYFFCLAILKFIFDRRVLRLAFSIFLEELRRFWPKA